jgi:hypothetical protein
MGIVGSIGATPDLAFQTNTTERMRITTSGNVGIGTSAPEGRLHVSGGQLVLKGGTSTDQQIVYNFAREYVNGIYNASGHFRLQDNSLGGTVYQWDGSSFCFPNGNIGIGTTAPAYKLDVTGAARFTSSVTATGFFESSDARLKTIVKENYRLDSIVSIKPKFYEKNGKFEVGYIAQEVEQLYPHAVTLGADGYLSLSYSQVHTLKLAYLEDSVEEIKRKIAYLEQQLNNK